MNCQECRSLVERFLDNALTGFTMRKVRLHLSRCANCKGYFDRRKQNQALAYRAMNDALAGECLPKDFAGRFLAAHIVPERRFWRLGLGRLWKVAAALVAMASFVGLAAVVISERHSVDMKDYEVAYPPQTDDVEKETEATEGTEDVSAVPSVSQVSSTAPSTDEPKGEQSMTMRKVAMSALAATMASAPLAAANGDEYQFIVSGELVSETTGCSSDSSETTSLTSGTLADEAIHGSELEARYRTMGDSNTCSLQSGKAGLLISIK